MKRALLPVVVIVLGLALVTVIAWVVVQRTTRQWFEKDVGLRARLAVSGARAGFVDRWGDPERLRALLSEVAHDERVMGAAACSADLEPLAWSADFPAAFSCADVESLRAAGAPDAWWEVRALRGGDVHLAAVPIEGDGTSHGYVLIVQDLSFVARREASTRTLLLAGFGLLALVASVFTVAVMRASWKRWSDDLRKSLRGEAPGAEFRPLMTDVRELVERLVSEREAEGEGKVWGPARLKQTLGRVLHGERVLVVANRQPYIHEREPGGGVRVLHPASGLVTALEPVLRACSGVWIAHGSGSADRETADSSGRLRVPPGEESYWIRRVWLSEEEERGYYYGFANEGLWPLCHVAHTRPVFRAEDWEQYRAVNEKFADAVLAEADGEDPIVLVQDYHFALAPKLIRERLPRATVLMFWHVPWPNAERFGICPYRDDILEGMLGASILGFHTQSHCNNFVDSIERFLEARTDREQNAVVREGRSTLVRPYPISIEWPVRWLENAPSAAECRAEIARELGLRDGALLGVGVDRLDYTKGIEERLLAVERLLERAPEHRGRFVFVQLAAPSRTIIPRYRELNEQVEKVASRINERFGADGYAPVILRRAHHEPPAVFKYYRAADVCYVSSLDDGMNLVAKEFVAARDDERGVLVLSQFTGAARELTEALVVNPYDLDEASRALATALSMPVAEQRERMRAMRSLVTEFNVYRWAGRMLVDAARVRNRERVTWRLKWAPAEAGRQRLLDRLARN